MFETRDHGGDHLRSLIDAVAVFPPLLSRCDGIESPFRNCHPYVKLVLIAQAPCGRLVLHNVEGAVMDCILVRHGIAVEPDEWEGAEENRPLTEKGKRRARQVAEGLAALDCQPTHLYTSPFVRAYDTTRLLRAVICPTLKVETREELAVGAKPEQLVTFLHALPPDAVVICVGHEPQLGEMVSLLLCGKALPNFPLKKAGAACLELTDGFKPGQGRLRWWLQPMQLRALGKRMHGKKRIGKS